MLLSSHESVGSACYRKRLIAIATHGREYSHQQAVEQRRGLNSNLENKAYALNGVIQVNQIKSNIFHDFLCNE